MGQVWIATWAAGDMWMAAFTTKEAADAFCAEWNADHDYSNATANPLPLNPDYNDGVDPDGDPW